MENVKGYEQKILQKIHFQLGIGDRMKKMQVGFRKCMKFFWAVLKENDDMNRPYVFVIKILGVTVFYPLILAEQKVGGVAGGTFARKTVTNLLNFNIGDASVFELDNNIRDQKRGFDGNARSVIWQNF